jgi:hypothetical protein
VVCPVTTMTANAVCCRFTRGSSIHSEPSFSLSKVPLVSTRRTATTAHSVWPVCQKLLVVLEVMKEKEYIRDEGAIGQSGPPPHHRPAMHNLMLLPMHCDSGTLPYFTCCSQRPAKHNLMLYPSYDWYVLHTFLSQLCLHRQPTWEAQKRISRLKDMKHSCGARKGPTLHLSSFGIVMTPCHSLIWPHQTQGASHMQPSKDFSSRVAFFFHVLHNRRAKSAFGLFRDASIQLLRGQAEISISAV